MLGKEIEPADIGKHQKLIRIAQSEMAATDVLVCGKCLSVFHFAEEFMEHKSDGCDKESALKESRETKPKVWAFLLWKATQIQLKDGNANSTNSWKLYQSWVKMDPSVQETWIIAGKTIQSFAKMGQGNLQEMPVKITKTVVDPSAKANSQNQALLIKQQQAIKNENRVLLNKKEEDVDVPMPVKNEPVKLIRKPVPAASSPQNALKLTTSTPLPSTRGLSRLAKRSVAGSNETVEENVEKIVAKRFNPRRKMHEYLVKWDTIPHDQNTWEPHHHLESVPQILEVFEKQLARQKEQRAAQLAKQHAAVVASAVKVAEVKREPPSTPLITPKDESSKFNLSSPVDSDSGRLSRSSKSRALEQVKQWCSDDQDSSAATTPGLVGVKRKLDDSDFDDSTFMEQEDFEDDLIPLHTVKRMKNGNTVSVRVETKNEIKSTTTIRQQPTKVTTTTTTVNGLNTSSNLASDLPSAEIVITKDSTSSGVVKKTPGLSNSSTQKTEAQIRVLSKGETTSSGIVRIGANNSTPATAISTPVGQSVARSATPSVPSHITIQKKQVATPVINRVVHQASKAQAVGRSTPPTNIGNVQITQVQQPTRTNPNQPRQQQQQQQQQQKPTPKFTTKISTPSNVQTNNQRTVQSQPRTGFVQRTSLTTQQQQQQQGTPNKMVIQRTVKSAPNLKNATPEQKIIQLSKSGDLKVTKKIVSSQAHQQHQQSKITGNSGARPRQEHSSQIQIQKVQQIAPPHSQSMQQKRKAQEIAQKKQQQQLQQQQQQYVTAAVEEEEEAALTLCPITGKILGQPDDANLEIEDSQHQQSHIQSGVMQTHLIASNQQAELQADESNELTQTIDLGGLEQQLLANEDGTPLLVTGEDGTIYQVAKNEDGQTILIAQGADGEQQYAYMATDENEAGGVLTVAEAVAQMLPEQQAESLAAAQGGETQYILKQEDGLTVVDGAGNAIQQPLSIQTGSDGGDGQESNIPAEVVQAELPSPGGTRRVVLLLQDGTFMMTEMHDDEYQALNLMS